MDEIRLTVDLPLMSKARPRCARGGHAYMPPNYREWKRQATDRLMAHWVDFDLPTLSAFEFHVTAYGPGRGDGDNLIAAMLDAGLPDKKTGWRGCWTDDRVTCCPALSFRWHRSKQPRWELLIKVL